MRPQHSKDSLDPAPRTQEKTVVIIDDFLTIGMLIKDYIRHIENTVPLVFTDPRTALEHCLQQPPALILVDYIMPNINGLEFIKRIREHHDMDNVPAIMITALEDKTVLYEALQHGANDFLRKPLDQIELCARIRNTLKLRAHTLALADANRRLLALATTDAQTGLVNRREFECRLQHCIERSQQQPSHHVLCYLDLDHFKYVNDSAGHEAGDELLRQVAILLNRRIRSRDTLARIGGDEFALLLENCAIGDAVAIAEQLVETIRSLEFRWQQQSYRISVSIGLTVIDNDVDCDLRDIMNQADSACYRAKHMGRDRVCRHRPEDSSPSMNPV